MKTTKTSRLARIFISAVAVCMLVCLMAPMAFAANDAVNNCRYGVLQVKLNYTGDKSGNLTRHNMFAATACPGPYLQSKFPYIAEEVNKRLAPQEDKGIYQITVADLSYDEAEDLKQYITSKGLSYTEEKTGEEPAPAPVEPEKEWVPAVGDVVYFKGGLQYSQANGATGSTRPAGQAKITKVFVGKHPYHLVKTGSSGPYGWVDRDSFEKA